MSDWYRLLRRAAFIVWLRLTSARRRRRIARLEAALAPKPTISTSSFDGYVAGLYPGNIWNVSDNSYSQLNPGKVFDLMDRAAKLTWLDDKETA